MSHFIICSARTIIFGTPNGQARTQLLQATQRGFSDDCTTPSSVFLIASAGRPGRRSGRRSACTPSGPWRCVLPVDEVHVDHRTCRGGCRTPRTRSRRPCSRCSARGRRRTRSRSQASGSAGAQAATTCSAARARRAAPAAFSMRHAETLNSGILLRGSSVRCVSRLALRPSGQ